MATNHLGHFALTGLLLDRLVTTERSRIVTVSSHMHRLGRLRLDDVAGTKAAQHLGRPTARRSWPTCSSRPSSAGASRRRGLPHPGPGGPPGLDAQQPGRQRRRPERQPGATQARSGRRLEPRAVGRGRRAARALRRHLVARPQAGSTSARPASSACSARRAWTQPSRRARDLTMAAAPVGGVGGADRRALLGAARPSERTGAHGRVRVAERRTPAGMRAGGRRRAPGTRSGRSTRPADHDDAPTPRRRAAAPAAALWARAPLT